MKINKKIYILISLIATFIFLLLFSPEPKDISGELTKDVVKQDAIEPEKLPSYVHYNIPLEPELQKYIQDLCNEKDIDYDLVLSVIKLESNFNSQLIHTNKNGTKDYGLCQLNSAYMASRIDDFGFEKFDYFNPYDNVKMGIYILDDIRNRRINDYSEEDMQVYLLNVYNMGEYGYKKLMSRYGGGIVSRAYDRRVLDFKLKLKMSEVI